MPDPARAAEHDSPGSPPSVHRLAYRADVDGLRAVAVSAVLAFHGFPARVPGGFAGVDVFFVISGFVISRIILSDVRAGRFSLGGFYARRIRRLFPALMIVLAVTLAIGHRVLLPNEFRTLGRHALAVVAYVYNVAAIRDAGYFDAAAQEKPLHHLWSLSVEEQFYAAWPLLLLAGVRFGVGRLLAVVFLASMAANVLAIGTWPTEVFYLPFTRAWELALGAAVAHWEPHATPAAANAAASIGAAAIVASLFVLDGQQYPGVEALLPTAGAAATIAAGPDAWLARRVLASRAAVAVGRISYPLYLWHWPLLVFAAVITAGTPPLVVRAGLLAAAVVLSAATYLVVERRVLAAARGPTAALVGVAAAVGGAAWLVAAGAVPPRSARYPVERIAAAADDWGFPKGLAPFRYGGSTFQRSGERAPVALFVGDSLMEQYWPRVEEVVRTRPAARSVVFATRGGCPPFAGAVYGAHRDCPAYMADVQALAASSDVDTVVVAAWWAPHFGPDAVRPGGWASAEDQARAFDSLERWLVALGASKRIVIVLASPYGDAFDPKRMLHRSLLRGFEVETRPVPRAELAAAAAPVNARLRRIAERAHAATFDPFEVLCDDGACPVVTATGEPIFRDTCHVRPFAVRRTMTFLDPIVSP